MVRPDDRPFRARYRFPYPVYYHDRRTGGSPGSSRRWSRCCTEASWICRQRLLRHSRKPGKWLRFLSLGMSSSTVPAQISQTQSRDPLRCASPVNARHSRPASRPATRAPSGARRQRPIIKRSASLLFSNKLAEGDPVVGHRGGRRPGVAGRNPTRREIPRWPPAVDRWPAYATLVAVASTH
jgi:hypothetical protein